jgi:hypothetical protein
MSYRYDTERRDYPITTALAVIRPEAIKILNVSAGVLAAYQRRMSKAVWRPAPGRKLGFLVLQDGALLGLIFLASPVIRLTARDEYLFPFPGPKFNYGLATKSYMDMSVCVAAQPIGWHWNLGKLMALIAPTLGDYVRSRYPDELLGVTTTSLWGKSTQYNRIYKFLGFTKGFGHEQITDVQYQEMTDWLTDRCSNCHPMCKTPLPLLPKHPIVDGILRRDLDPLPKTEWCTKPYARFGDGVNARMRVAAYYYRMSGEKGTNLDGRGAFYHGKKRGVYYHAAVPSSQRRQVIQHWYERWGLPRYERTKNEQSPYQNGLDGRIA